MSKKQLEAEPAVVVREYGPFPGVANVGGVSFDGSLVWCATGPQLTAFAPDSGAIVRTLPVECDSGTAFDGKHLYQLLAGQIRKIEHATGRVLATLPTPCPGTPTGLTWAEGSLWVGDMRARMIHKLDPDTGEVLRSLSSDRFVTGVSFVQGELWHATWEGDQSELRQVDSESGEVLARAVMPAGAFISGLESDGDALFFCGGGGSGLVRAVQKPRRR